MEIRAYDEMYLETGKFLAGAENKVAWFSRQSILVETATKLISAGCIACMIEILFCLNFQRFCSQSVILFHQ